HTRSKRDWSSDVCSSDLDPPILILDEPTVGLDPKQIIEIRQLIRDLAGARTIILSTHILPEATAVAKRVVIINDGRIVAEDTQRSEERRVGKECRSGVSR